MVILTDRIKRISLTANWQQVCITAKVSRIVLISAFIMTERRTPKVFTGEVIRPACGNLMKRMGNYTRQQHMPMTKEMEQKCVFFPMAIKIKYRYIKMVNLTGP